MTNVQEAQKNQKALPPGTKAPDFSLPTTPNQRVSLREFRGQPVVLVFYPEDWSPVCGSQLALYNQILPTFKEHGATVLGISTDNVWSHLAYTEQKNIQFPLLSDFEPKGAVAKQYGVYRDESGTSERALFLIDEEGVIRWSYVSPVGINPGADGILRALENLDNEREKG